MVMGEVVWVNAADHALASHLRIDPAKADAIGRMGGPTYTRTRERFEIPPGKAALGFIPEWPAP